MIRRKRTDDKYPNNAKSRKRLDSSHEMMLVYAGPVRRPSETQIPDESIVAGVYAGPNLMGIGFDINEQPVNDDSTNEKDVPSTICKECGQKISVTAKFCPECGAPGPGIAKV